ncbi:hypothetical protein NON20_02750 [Synechocystis sp. B12]|nr:hypothetical protein NON20_02750 [Synechocystis sp. B12]
MIPAGKPSQSTKTNKPWWKRGIFSSDNAFGRWLQKILNKFLRTKEAVPEEALFAYRQAPRKFLYLAKAWMFYTKKTFCAMKNFVS